MKANNNKISSKITRKMFNKNKLNIINFQRKQFSNNNQCKNNPKIRKLKTRNKQNQSNLKKIKTKNKTKKKY